jgi:protein involved in polysaccharide export with SLBB domain
MQKHNTNDTLRRFTSHSNERPFKQAATLNLRCGLLALCCFSLAAGQATRSFAAPSSTRMAKANKSNGGFLPLPASPPQNNGTGNDNSADSGADPAAKEYITKTYVLAPDDRITITSVSHEEIGFQGTISSDGKISVPKLGSFMAAGKTVDQLEHEILKKMDAAGFIHPMATVSLSEAKKRTVFVLKAKGSGGSYDIKPGWRISDVLAFSQALGDYPATLVDATLTRRGEQKQITLDLPALLLDPNGKANITVQNGDTLRIVPRTVQVTFAGKIAHAGVLDVPIGSSLVEALALAGGVETTKAALTRASLKRATGEIIPLNLFDVLIKGQPEPRIQFIEGDLILVPEAQERVTAQGAIQKSGYFDIEDGKTLKLSELIALAGGVRSDAAQTRTVVQHEDGTSQVIDLYKVTALLDEKNNIVLKPNDIITVPSYAERVTVAGSGVRSAAFVPITEGMTMRVLTALTTAGGLADEPEAMSITITRDMPGSVPTLDPTKQPAEPTILTVDPVKLYKLNDPNENIPLQNGDLIMVTSNPRKVYLSGEVKSPGVLEFKAGEGITEILKQAGGATDNGLLSGVIVERGGQKFVIDVFKAINNGEQVNFPLHPGDNIVVPKNMNRVLILPGVNDAGYHAIPEDRPLTVVEALALAGGPRGDAELKNTTLLRMTPQGMKPEAVPLRTSDDWVKASKIIMSKGDILYLPVYDQRRKQTLGSKFMGLMPFANMLTGGIFPIF